MSEKLFFSFVLFIALTWADTNSAYSQCETWLGLSNSEEVIDAHSVYRQALKVEDMEIAMENWKIAYENAPAADGQRDFHYMDGITIFKYKIQQTDDENLIAEYRDNIIRLYDEVVNCYLEEKISLRNCSDSECYRKRAGSRLGRLVYDMFYEFKSPSDEVYKTSQRVFELSGMDTEYIVLVPAIASISRLYKANQLTDEETVAGHQLIEEILAYNIENNETQAAQYEAVVPSINHYVTQFERDLYDCSYFKDKLMPDFESRPRDGEMAKDIYSQLLSRGCSEDDPELADIKLRSEQYVDSVNVAMKLELEENNPALAARRLFEEGDYSGAIAEYKRAISMEEDDEKKGEFYFRIASIQGRQLNQYSNARKNALNAAKLKPNWGVPYILIGDLYASTSRNCGDDWNQRLAVLAAIEKYRQAARVDSKVAEDALNRANRYQASKPDSQEGHMRSVSEGEKVEVGCWINETVTIRFK